MKRSTRVSSAEIVGSAESIVSIIFLYLPMMSLLRFKSVCKDWYHMISDPLFIHAHTTYSIKKDPSFLAPYGYFISSTFDDQIKPIVLPKSGRKPSMPSLSFLGKDFKIFQSCNGLLLCRLRSGRFCVCNPTTRKRKIIPSVHKLVRGFSWISPLTLAFDPSQSPHYKIVCFKKIKSTGSNSYFQILMYLSETRTWKCTTSTFEANICRYVFEGIFSNGAVHWVCHEQYIRFDINEGEVMLKTLPFIHGVHEYSWQVGRLWQWDGTVYCAIESDFDWNLHELDHVTFEWTEFKYGVSCYRLLEDVLGEIIEVEGEEEGQRCDLIKHKFSILGIVKGDEEQNTLILAALFGKIVAYHLATGEVKIIVDLELPDAVAGDVCSNCLTAHQFIETLSAV